MAYRSRTNGYLAAAAGVALLAPWTAQAQTQPSREELNPAARATAGRQAERDLFAPEPAGPCPLRDSNLQVTLKSVTFQGLTAVTADKMTAAYAEFIGRPAPVAAICDIRDRAARILYDRGILARVIIPEQRIADGALTFLVVEAHVVGVHIHGDAGPAQAQVERYLDKLRGMTPFRMDKAQRYLLLAGDVPGVKVRAALRPSASGERGAVDLDVTVSRKAYEAEANVQNYGSRVVGRWGAVGRADFNSFTSLGERTSVVLYHTLDSHEQAVIQVQEEARFGGDGLLGRASVVYGESRPGDVLAPLDLTSLSFIGEAEAAYPLIRMRRRNLNLAGGLDWVDLKTNALGTAFNQDHLRVLYLRLDGTLRENLGDHPVDLSGALQVRQGVSGMGASDPADPLISRFGADPAAFVVRFDGALRANLAGRLGVSVRAEAQYSSKVLLPYEEMALGNLSIGRGYDPAAALGDKGAAAAFELTYGPLRVSQKAFAVPYAFYDVGRITSNQTGLSTTLASAGAGVRFNLAQRAQLDVAYAKAFDEVVPGAGKPGGRLLISLTGVF